MVPAPAHVDHEVECDTCEDDRRAARALFENPTTGEAWPIGS